MVTTRGLPNGCLLICPSLQQFHGLDQYRDSLYEFFAIPKKEKESWFWKAFAKPVDDAQCIQRFQPKSRPSGKLSLLECLPVDLIEVIIDVLRAGWSDSSGGMESVITLGLSSPYLWKVVLNRIHRKCAGNYLPLWAGKKVTFQSYYPHTTLNTLPECGFESTRLPWSVASTQPELEWAQRVRGMEERCTHYASREGWESFPPNYWETIMDDVLKTNMYPQNHVWLLRNLTTRQFVRSDELRPPKSIVPREPVPPLPKPRLSRFQKLQAVWKRVKMRFESKQATKADGFEPKEASRADDFEPLTLAQIFLVMICHSNVNLGSWFLSSGAGTQGPWNMHSFDVVTLEDHLLSTVYNDNELGPHRKDWIDVSRLVVADVGNLRWCVKQSHARDGHRWDRENNINFQTFVKRTRHEHRAWVECDADVKEKVFIMKVMNDVGTM
jgi:hypothetical protein